MPQGRACSAKWATSAVKQAGAASLPAKTAAAGCLCLGMLAAHSLPATTQGKQTQGAFQALSMQANQGRCCTYIGAPSSACASAECATIDDGIIKGCMFMSAWKQAVHTATPCGCHIHVHTTPCIQQQGSSQQHPQRGRLPRDTDPLAWTSPQLMPQRQHAV
jgi:hypothetical protein